MVKFYSKLKQPIEKADLNGVVYRVSCKENDTKYIGETIQKVSARMNQHNNDCSDRNLAKNTKKRTALACHTKETGHQFDFDLEKVEVLKRERRKAKLKIQEVNQIIMHEDQVCNFKSDTMIIGPAYGNLLKQFKINSDKKLHRIHQPRQRIHRQHDFNHTSRQLID